MLVLFLPLAAYWAYETVWKYRPSTLVIDPGTSTHHGTTESKPIVSERTHLRAIDEAVKLHAENCRLRAEIAGYQHEISHMTKEAEGNANG